MRRRWLAILAASGLLLGACGGGAAAPSSGGGPASSSGGGAPEQPLKVTAAVSGYDAYLLMMPIHVAVDKGFFKQQGLQVDITTTGGGGDTLRAATTGGMDIAVGGADAAIAAVVKGQGVTIVAPYWQTTDNAWLAPEGSSIKAIQDLKGHSVSYTSPGSATDFMARESMRRAGISDAQFVKTGGDGDTWAAVKAGKVDTAWAIEPLLTMHVQQDHAHVIFYAAQEIPHFMMDAIAVNNDFLKAHPDAVRGLLKALIDGMQFVKDHPDEAAASTAPELKVDKAILVDGLKNEPNKDRGLSFKVDPDAFKTIEQGMLTFKTLDAPIKDWNKIVDQSYLPENLRTPIPAGG